MILNHRQETYVGRHLQVHPRKVPVLPAAEEQEVAEQHPTQSNSQRLLPENAKGTGETRKGKLLDAAPRS